MGAIGPEVWAQEKDAKPAEAALPRQPRKNRRLPTTPSRSAGKTIPYKATAATISLEER